MRQLVVEQQLEALPLALLTALVQLVCLLQERLSGFLLSPISINLETKMLCQHFLALADILKQFVNLSH